MSFSMLWNSGMNAIVPRRIIGSQNDVTLYMSVIVTKGRVARTLRARCRNAQLTVWLANRGLTLTAQLTRCALQEAQLSNRLVNCASLFDLFEPPY